MNNIYFIKLVAMIIYLYFRRYEYIKLGLKFSANNPALWPHLAVSSK